MKRRSGIAVLFALLAGCAGAGGETTPTPGPEPTFVPIVSATGQVVPIRWSSLSLPSGGIVSTLPVVEGDLVAEEDLLLQLSGREQLVAAVAAARVEEILAQQALDKVIDEEDLARALAQEELALARDELKDAEYTHSVRQEGNRANADTIEGWRVRLVLAKEEMEDAKDRFDSADGTINKNQAYDDYASAKASYNSALANYNWFTGHPTDVEQAMLEADVAVAAAKVEQAEAAVADVQDGVDPDALALAQARAAQAKTALAAAEAALRDTELRAPFPGTVSGIHIRANEWVGPGQPVIDLADLTQFQVETTDLSEIDAARVAIGAPVTITFDALPETVAQGRVVRIAPKASEGSGVNYTVWIELEEVPPGLLWGMTAFADIEATP